MDLEIYEKVNFTYDDTEERKETPHIALDIAYSTLVIIYLVITVLIVYIILHFKHLQSNFNITLVNLCIADAVGLLFRSPICTNDLLEIQTYCFFFELMSLLQSAVLAFQILIATDWFIEKCLSKHTFTWRKNYKVAICGIWAAVVFSFVFSVNYCFNGHFIRGPWTELVLLVILIAMVVAAHTLKCIYFYWKNKAFQAHNGLAFVTVVALFRILELILALSLEGVFTWSFRLVCIVELLSSVILLTFLCRWDSEFNICFKDILRCRCQEDTCDEPTLERNPFTCTECGRQVHNAVQA